LRTKIKEYMFITMGIIMVAIGTYYFLAAENLAAGGISGLAMVVNHYFSFISIGLFMLCVDIILFVIAFLLIGPSFGAKTIYASLGLSGIIWVLESTFPINGSITGDTFLSLIYGVLIAGIGMGIVFNQNASTGGTDIIAKIINKFSHIDIGKAMIMADIVVVILAALTFGIRIGMYALLGVIMNGVVIDSFINGLSMRKQVTIISAKGDEIKKFIMDELERGVTIYDAKGAYTGEEKEVLTTIMSRKEFIKLKGFIKKTDIRAFVTVSNVHEVLGEGFKNFDE
jgi:uncharacterized membrane-anchored protein YitT (DUF2179 family)